MGYLTPADYKSQIRDEIKTLVSDAAGGDDTLYDAELKAQSEVESYLNHRFDVAAIFIDVPEYDGATAYLEGDVVYYEDSGSFRIYTANADTSPGEDPTGAKWDVADPRHKHLIRIMVDIVLYLLYESNSPRSMPQSKGLNYDNAVKWLKMVARADLNPGLPLLTDDPGNPAKTFDGDGSTTDEWW